VIEGVCPISPSDVVYEMISYMQRWRALLRGEEQAKMEVKLQQVGGDEGDPREAEKIYARRRCNLKESAC
jgi:hypothetical protein